MEGNFFVLLDAEEDNKAQVGQVFIPEDIRYYNQVYKTGKSLSFIQEKVTGLGFTLLKPIIQNRKVVGLLVMDYTQSRLSSISNMLDLMVRYISIFFFFLLFLIFLFLCYMLYVKYTKNKIYQNPKTGTLNRVFLSENYEKIDFKNYYVALADLDFFKRVNNIYGQKTGDKILNLLIYNLSTLLKPEDMFIQYSGEEFLLLISKKNREEIALKNLLEDIRIHVERTRFLIKDEYLFLTLSIGALMGTDLEKSLHDCIHKADTALYSAKHNGRNNIRYYDTSQAKRIYRDKLQEMIFSDKLVCFYQPICSLTDSSVHHYEALLRIKDGDTIIFPDKILPDLEDSYLYSHLTKKIIEYNVKILRMDSNIKISINLSADDLINDSVISLLAQNADLSNRILIEILENKSINYKKVELTIQKLKLFGYKICIDDFGSGYANLNHLLNLSIDYLKFDGSIIKEIHHDKRAYSIVKTFAEFCQENGIEVIAEFIDNEEVKEILISFGVEYGQGFYFSPGKPYEELDLD